MITLYGASDDLIEIEGDIREEFPYRDLDGKGDLIGFSNGMLVRVLLDGDGVWRIHPIRAMGRGTYAIEQAQVGDDDNYSDRLTIPGVVVEWAVHGEAAAIARFTDAVR